MRCSPPNFAFALSLKKNHLTSDSRSLSRFSGRNPYSGHYKKFLCCPASLPPPPPSFSLTLFHLLIRRSRRGSRKIPMLRTLPPCAVLLISCRTPSIIHTKTSVSLHDAYVCGIFWLLPRTFFPSITSQYADVLCTKSRQTHRNNPTLFCFTSASPKLADTITRTLTNTQ